MSVSAMSFDISQGSDITCTLDAEGCACVFTGEAKVIVNVESH